MLALIRRWSFTAFVYAANMAIVLFVAWLLLLSLATYLDS